MAVSTRANTSSGQRRASASALDFLRLLLRLLAWRFVGLVLLTMAIGLVSGTAVVMLVPMLQVVGMEVPAGGGEKMSEAVAAGFALLGLTPDLPTILLANVAVVSAGALLTRFQVVLATRLNQSVVRRLRRRIYVSISQADWLYLARERGSHFSHLLLGELERVGAAMSALVSLLVAAGRTVVYTVIALALSPLLTAVTVAFGLLLALLLLHRTRLAKFAGGRVSASYQRLYATVQDHLAALKLVKSHALEDGQLAEFERVTGDVERAHVDVVRNQAEVSLWLEVGTVLGLSVLVWTALGLLELPLATVLLLLYLFSRLLPMVNGVQRNYQTLTGLLPAYAQLERSLAESDGARESDAEDAAPFSLRRSLHLRDVTFRYDSAAGTAGVEIELDLPAGSTTALVGPSGAGKSTVADLAIGLITPERGEILIDGESLSAERRRAWRKQVGYVSQDSFLFHDSIRANLLLAAPGATEQDLWEALELASAQFVRTLPEGLDTVVGDRGVRLSGGERQRIVLARSLLRKPALLVLDEATSALDAENEERVREAIDALAGRVTILLIAHRLAAVRTAHAIHVMERGHVVESGNWQELMCREGGRLRALAATQGLEAGPDVPDSVASSVPDTLRRSPSSTR